jgi:acetyltransferase-like isoleucine patch superfamily enzyme
MRHLEWDWYPGTIPDNVELDSTAYLETTFSFHLYRSRVQTGVRFGKGSSAYLGTMFDVGPEGAVTLGEYALVHGARIICDRGIEIGDHALISWNVVLMDTYRAGDTAEARRIALRQMSPSEPRVFPALDTARPIRIGNNVWIGFDVCILPGVSIGDGSIIGAKSVVNCDVPPYCVAVGNPARVIQRLDTE